jgi:hypothetical protein
VTFRATFARGTQWDLEWTDGPTASTVGKTLSTMELAGADVKLHRFTSPRAIALAVIRTALAGKSTHTIRLSSWSSDSLNWELEDTEHPQRCASVREEHLVSSLMAAAIPCGYPVEDHALRLVNERGLAWLLHDIPTSELSAIEVLTATYATGGAKRLWERQTMPMNAQAAIDAAITDPAIGEAGVLALLDLLAQQRAQAGQAEAAAVALAVTAGVSWRKIAAAVGVTTEEQARNWAPGTPSK